MNNIQNISETRKNSIRRLKIISGQIFGLIKLIEEEDCNKLLTQVKATKSAFNGFTSELMKNLLSECLYDIKKENCSTENCEEKKTQELEKINEIITKFTSI
ncbi:TPA: metal-sensitive transcriptional regulator [Candidatus Peregrinibacteria bacterium]|nr:metal-sensitive transcriptional regulator [Candidatus Peregrinibacteria bacterium]HIQ57483.1 metal-sensitive transcriptional regulator [Candidatus Gracilibacteria bacterium]